MRTCLKQADGGRFHLLQYQIAFENLVTFFPYDRSAGEGKRKRQAIPGDAAVYVCPVLRTINFPLSMTREADTQSQSPA